MCRSMLVSCLLVASVSAALRKSLVILDDASREHSHSKLISHLKTRGNEVTVKLAKDDSLEIKKYGEYLYDSILLLCPETKEFGGELDEGSLLEFVDAGNSLVVLGSTTVGAAVREVASECGVDFDDKKTVVLDHFNFDSSDADGGHTLIVADHFSSSSILNGFDRKPVLFQGTGLTVDKENPLVIKLLSGNPTTYSANPSENIDRRPASAGSNTVLVAAVQTRGRGRVLVSGSIELFSDKLFSASLSKHGQASQPSGNQQFALTALGWTLQERGVLRARNLSHHLADGSSVEPRMYRVKDDIHFSIVIEEYDGIAHQWKPYVADDVQLEFRMLDPYIRLTLTPSGNGTFFADFKIPDVYGVFKFQIDYRRDGYSHIVLSQEIGVRPFRHNEFERFIASANPYYVSSLSMMCGFVLFSFVFLFTKEKEKQA